METVITVTPAELDAGLLKKIKKFIGKKNNMDVVISLREYDPAYVEALEKSIDQAETGAEIITMSMEEFVAYTPDIKK